jgi:hypothetical protein
MRTIVAIAAVTLALAPAAADAQNRFMDSLKGTLDKIQPDSSGTGGSATTVLTNSDIVAGLRDALKVGAERVVQTIGKADGYNKDPDIHIPLPPSLQNVQSTLRRVGMSRMADDLELKLNRAAETAAPKTKAIIWDAITRLTLDDARTIYDGPDDAATQYFRKTSTGDLKGVVRPVVDDALNQVGAIASYDNMMKQYKAVPFVPDVKANLSDHTVELALKGLFHYLAKEEAAIRNDPAKRTTEILAKVFGR